MNKKLSKVLIFVAGGAVGAAISAFVTDRVVDKTYRRAADEEIYEANKVVNEKIKGYKEQIKELQEKVKRQKVTINTLADQVRESGGNETLDKVLEEDDDEDGDPGRDIRSGIQEHRTREKVGEVQRRTFSNYRSAYNSRPKNNPYGYISEDAEYPFPSEDIDPEEEEDSIRENSPRRIDEDTFSTTALSYSKEDLYYYIYDGKVISEDGEWIDNYTALIGDDWVSGATQAGDELYIRNDDLAVDYHIMLMAGYGEEHISTTDIWDED